MIDRYLNGDVICRDLFGGGSQTGTTQTTISNRPIQSVEDALGRLIPQAEALAEIPVQQPGFSTVVPFSGQTEQALQLQEQRALGGNPLETEAQNAILETVRGDFLQRQNPGFEQFAQTLSGDIGSQINAQFSDANRLGSQGNAQALGRGIGNALSPLAFQDFQRERQNQLGAAELAPGLAGLDFTNIQALRDVGGSREAQLGAGLQEDLNRFNFAQLEPRQRIAEVLALIGGGQFGSNQTQLRPTFSNPTATGIGNAASLASIAGSLFGSGGVFGRSSSGGTGSDRRLKTDIKRIGYTDDGLPIYTYRLKSGGPHVMGVMAQELEVKHPELVGERDGFKTVYYEGVS